MTKMLMIGMPLAEVIRASTSTPAKAIGYAGKIGTLQVGLEADVAVLEIRRTDFGMLLCLSVALYCIACSRAVVVPLVGICRTQQCGTCR